MKHLLSLMLISAISHLCYAQSTIIFDDFESYASGDLLAENSGLWTTWSGGIDAEDAPVSAEYAFSGSNSVKIFGPGGPTDLILPFSSDYVSGSFEFTFQMYLVSGNGGYFNIQQSSQPGVGWMLDAFFDSQGGGYLQAAGNNPTFSYVPDSWNNIRLLVDLNSDYAEFYINSVFIYSWQWSLSSSGYPTFAQIGGVDFFAYTPDGSNCHYYIDDVKLLQFDPPAIITGDLVESACEGSAIVVPFTTSFAFNPGNIFTAELSDPVGSFAAPTAIGFLQSTTSGVIAATITEGISLGTGYRIRVVSSDPDTVGSSSNITIQDSTLYYLDIDGDGWGTANSYILDCSKPDNYSEFNTDCNDADAGINPAAADYPDGVDNNCDGCIDANASYMYPDADGDGYGENVNPVLLCEVTAGYSFYSGDCNDADASINPAAPDYQDGNGIDNNCDGCVDGYLFYVYPDADGDGYGANTNYVMLCDPTGYSLFNNDCNDSDSNIYPGANEVSDGLDQNCDGQIDEIQSCYPFIQWDQSFGGTGSDAAQSITNAIDGGFVVSGYEYSMDGDMADCNPYLFGWTAKINSSGGMIWQRCSDFQVTGIASTPDTGYIITGARSNNLVVTKISDTGDFVWDTEAGGSDIDFGSEVFVNSDGSFVIAGNTYSNDGDVTGHHGKTDMWLVKFGPNGDLLWQKCLGGSEDDVAYDVVQTTDSGYFAVGYTFSTDGDVIGNTFFAGWAVKLDSSGNIQWQKTFTNYGGWLTSCIETNDGKFAVLYSFASNGSFAIKLDSEGNEEWSALAECYGEDLIQTNDDGFAMSGGTYSLNGAAYHYDAVVSRFSDSGEMLWSRKMGGTGEENGSGILQTSDLGYVIAGYASSTDGDVSENNGSTDYWVVKLSEDPPSGIQTYYADADGDGYGNPNDSITDVSCVVLPGYSYYNSDCNDADSTIHPAATEDCGNGIDDDCNGVVDDGETTLFYVDADNDGYGNVASSVYSCEKPTGYVENNTDCDDGNSAIHPGAQEICNAIDDNCNLQSDEGLPVYYADSDADGFGNLFVSSCVQSGNVLDNTDCDDDNSSINPAASEICDNNVDDNCNGQIDEGCTDECILPASLSVTGITATSAMLNWDVVEGAIGYKLRYKVAGTGEWTKRSTSDNFKKLYNLSPETKYTWQVAAICNLSPNDFSEWSEKQFFTLPLKESAGAGTGFELQVFPNPAKDLATIRFFLYQSSHVHVVICDISGKEILTLLNVDLLAEEHSITFNTGDFSKGVYLVKMISDFGKENRKLVVQ